MNAPTALAAGALAAILVLAGCADDEDAAGTATTTTEAEATTTTADATGDAPTSRAAFCTDLQAAFADYQPGFDEIFADGNDAPTLDEWAAFLPDEVAAMDAMIGRVSAVEVPEDDPEMAAAMEDAVGAFEAMSANFDASIDAAEAGDQAAFDEATAKNQDELTPAVQEATGVVGELCGFPQG